MTNPFAGGVSSERSDVGAALSGWRGFRGVKAPELPVVRTAISSHRACPLNTLAPKSNVVVKTPSATATGELVIGEPTALPAAVAS